MSSSPNKRLRVTSIVNINSTSHYQKIVNHTTGETRIFDKPGPHQIKKHDSVTTNPLEYTTSKPKKPVDPGVKSNEKLDGTEDFDSTALNR